MKARPAIAKQLLAVLALSLAALPASGWASLYCYHFGSPFWSDLDASLAVFQPGALKHEGVAELGDFYASFLPGYWIKAAIALLWFIALAVYLWRTRRDAVGLGLAVAPVTLFSWASIESLRMAWPACNAF